MDAFTNHKKGSLSSTKGFRKQWKHSVNVSPTDIWNEKVFRKNVSKSKRFYKEKNATNNLSKVKRRNLSGIIKKHLVELKKLLLLFLVTASIGLRTGSPWYEFFVSPTRGSSSCQSFVPDLPLRFSLISSLVSYIDASLYLPCSCTLLVVEL